MKNDVISLLSGEFYKDGEGYNALSIKSQNDIFAEVKSPKRAQRDSALRHDYVATLTVIVNSDEYLQENFLEFNGKRYEIKESYKLNSDEIELTCSDARC